MRVDSGSQADKVNIWHTLALLCTKETNIRNSKSTCWMLLHEKHYFGQQIMFMSVT